MRNILLYILLLLPTTSYAQPYQDITSDWCKMGLRGKVKEIKHIRFNSQEHYNNNTPSSIIITKFSKDGYTTKRKIDDMNWNHAIISQRKYFDTANKRRGYIDSSRVQFGPLQNNLIMDSVINFTIDDTSYIKYTYDLREKILIPYATFTNSNDTLWMDATDTGSEQKHLKRKEIYTLKKHTLETETIRPSKKDTIREYTFHYYDKNGDVIKTLDKNSSYESATLYEIKSRDRYNNPIVIHEYVDKEYIYILHATYTYYD